MPLRRKTAWLLALTDPLGPRGPLPQSRLRAPEMDWLVREALRHGVLPACVTNLGNAADRFGAGRVVRSIPGGPAAGKVLADALSEGRRMLRSQRALSLVLRRQLRQIGRAVASRSLPVTVIKGAEFADRLYPRPALRPFTDVDLLALHEAVPAVEHLLEGLGYRPVPAPDRKYARGYGERTWRLARGPGGAVEVHWNLVNSPSQRRAVSVRYGDLALAESRNEMGFTVASPASLLLVAAVHGALGHRFDRLQGLSDLCQAARGAAGEPDVAWLREACRRTGASAAMAAALHLGARALREPACSRLAERLGSAGPGRFCAMLVSPGVVVNSEGRLPKLRRQMLREALKRL